LCAMIYILGSLHGSVTIILHYQFEKKNLVKKMLTNVKWKLDLAQCSCHDKMSLENVELS
jgi:hypothetical protein